VEVGEVLTLLLGGGLVATIAALFQGIRSLRDGARAREKDTVKELVKQRKEAWIDRDNAIDRADYWQQWAGTVEYLARRKGVELPVRPAEPVPKQMPEDEDIKT
jgi:hypothetical protein